MPPVTKAGGAAFRKDVAFVTKDEEQQIASGIVMVPDKVDLQRDFAREETIRGFADQFETFVEAGQAGGGVMHAVWPDGWMDLERNEVLDEAEEIGGQEVQAGAWVQDWKIDNDELWGLIQDGILEGYSIGAIDVDWNGPFEQDDDEVDDVEVPEEIDEDELVWELVSGIIREVSAVDIPAVPDAQILEAKALEKRLADHIGNREGFIEEALQRGHSEADAERLWDVLNAAVESDGSTEPGKQSVLAKAGKAFLNVLTGTDDDTDVSTSEAPNPAAEKEGRTLSRANRDDLKASIDAAVSVLNDAGVDHGITRFTDREDDPFDLSEHSARTFANPNEEEEDDPLDPTQAAPTDEHAPEGDTSDADNTMSNDTDDPWDDAPEWAKDLRDEVKENSTRIDEQAEQLEAALEVQQEEKTARIEIDGEVYEVTESEAKAWFEEGQQPADDPMADAPAYVRALSEKVDAVNQRIDTISRQSGVSNQLEAARDDEVDDESGLGALGKALS